MMPQVNIAPKHGTHKNSKDKNLKYSQQLAQSVLASHLQDAPTGFSGVGVPLTKKEKESMNATMQLHGTPSGIMPSYVNSGTASSKSHGPTHHPPRGGSS